MPFNLFKKKPKGEDRGRSSSSSGISTSTKDDKGFRRSLSVGSIFEKTSKYDSIDEGDSPIDYDPSGAVTFIVKQKLFESRGEIIQRKLVINTNGLHFVDVVNGTVYEEYRFEKIKAFFYAEDNCFVVINVSKNEHDENVVFKTTRQGDKVKQVIETTIAQRVQNEQQRQKQSMYRPAPPIPPPSSNSAPNLLSQQKPLSEAQDERKWSSMTSIPRPASKVQYNTSTDFFEEGSPPKVTTFSLNSTSHSRFSNSNANSNRSLSMTSLRPQPTTQTKDLISFDD